MNTGLLSTTISIIYPTSLDRKENNNKIIIKEQCIDLTTFSDNN